jgi:hypothetical protein
MSTSGFHDPDVVALRIQRLERVMKFVFNQVYNKDNRDVNVARTSTRYRWTYRGRWL